MDNNKTYVGTELNHNLWQTKLADYALLVKLKLSLVVVVSSVLGYLIVSDGNGLFIDIIKLVIGGFLVTGAANAINQVLEKDFDILMTRTANRPVATGRMKSNARNSLINYKKMKTNILQKDEAVTCYSL